MIDLRLLLGQMAQYNQRAGAAFGPAIEVPESLKRNTVVVGWLVATDRRVRRGERRDESARAPAASAREGFLMLPPATARGSGSFWNAVHRLPQVAYLQVDLLEDVALPGSGGDPAKAYAYLTKVWGVDPGVASEKPIRGYSHLYQRGAPPPQTRAGLAKWVMDLSNLGGVPAIWVQSECAPRLLATLAANDRREGGEAALDGLCPQGTFDGLGDWDLGRVEDEPVARRRRVDVSRARRDAGGTSTRRPDVDWSLVEPGESAVAGRASRYFDPLYPRFLDMQVLEVFGAVSKPFAQHPERAPFLCNVFSLPRAGRLFASLWDRLFPESPNPHLATPKKATLLYSLGWPALRDIYRNLYLALADEGEMQMQAALREAMVRLVVQRIALRRWYVPTTLEKQNEDLYRVEHEPLLWGVKAR